MSTKDPSTARADFDALSRKPKSLLTSEDRFRLARKQAVQQVLLELANVRAVIAEQQMREKEIKDRADKAVAELEACA